MMQRMPFYQLSPDPDQAMPNLISAMDSGLSTLVHSSLWPTRDQYLWLLRMEASDRGLLFNSEKIESLPQPFACDEDDECFWGDLTPDQWLDVDKYAEPGRPSACQQKRETEEAMTTSTTERRALLSTYAWLYLEGIKKKIDGRLLKIGSQQSQDPSSIEAVLHGLGTLWTSIVEQACCKDKPPPRIGIFSDIPQEETTIEYINAPFNLSYEEFKTQAAGLGIVRHLTQKHHPALADSIFLHDDLVYHRPYPTAIDETDPAFPAEIYPINRDYDATDNGWYAQVAPLDKPSMLNQERDWRPINTEADWKSLLRVVKHSNHKVFMRHKSVEDRMDFIKQHREREELEMAKTGGVCTNVFLKRHMQEMYPGEKPEGIFPKHRDSMGENRLTSVPTS